MKLFEIFVNGLQLLTKVTKTSILDVAGVLDIWMEHCLLGNRIYFQADIKVSLSIFKPSLNLKKYRAHLTNSCVHVLIPLFHTVKFSSSKKHVLSQQQRPWSVGDKDIRAIKQILQSFFYGSTVDFEQVLAFYVGTCSLHQNIYCFGFPI